MNFTFDIVSPKYGTFTVTAPLRFKEEIERHTWYVRRNRARAEGRQFEVRANAHSADGEQIKLYLHQFIWSLAGKPRTKQIDHRDGQPLNNDEDNLRAATSVQNGRNRQKRRDNTSGAIGVSWHKSTSKWQAYVKIDGKIQYLGLFATVEEAVTIRDAAVAQHYGDFGVLNRPDQLTRTSHPGTL